MTNLLETRAEVEKLATLLDCDPDSLGYLEKCEPDDLRSLREQATDRLFDADRRVLQRIAAASRVVPVALVARLGEGVFGPLLCARVAGLLEPERAVDVAKRLPAAFLADVALSLDPRRVSDVIAQMPTDRIVAVARELLSRGEFVAMGRFVGYLPDEALVASTELFDGAAVLRIAFVLEGKDRLDHIVTLLSDQQLREMIIAADREQLWPEVLDVLSVVDDRTAERLETIAALTRQAPLPAPARSDPDRS